MMLPQVIDTTQEMTGPPLLKQQDLSHLKIPLKAIHLQFPGTD